MATKEEKLKLVFNSFIILILLCLLVALLIWMHELYFPKNQESVREASTKTEYENRISEIIKKESLIEENLIFENMIETQNDLDEVREETIKKEEILEYLTEYKTNKEIPKGMSYVVQEGRQGIQELTIKLTYDINNNLISEEQIDAKIKKSPANKIVEIGGGSYTSDYTVKKNDMVYVTSDILSLWEEPSEESRKITTIKKDEKVKVLDIEQSWYKIAYKSITGWVKSECTTYMSKDQDIVTEGKTKQQLLATLNFNMQLDKPSGLTLEQFKKVLEDSKDENSVFKDNAEYFYYIEKQYNINGIFVAAVGIHESAWGTSKIARDKNNLFGYGAYDSNPYNGAYSFKNYSESIDLIARVFVKYYLNPSGTSIYGGETAVGTYYNGKTLSEVNTRYASDSNWANGVYAHMKYLYNKL